jgi:hypothetical protein
MTAVLGPLRTAHDARAAELHGLILGTSTRLLAADGGAKQTFEELTRLPACAPPSDGVLQDRISRALDTFFARKDARPYADRRAQVSVGIGCEEQRRVLVTLGLGIALGESVRATYEVDDRSAKLLVDGLALAHADLDGDGRRDVVWSAPHGNGTRVAVRFAGTGREQSTPLEVGTSEDSDYVFAGAPLLRSAFALVRAHRGPYASDSITQRLRWDGKEFASVERLTDDDFEARYEAARERELAVLDAPMLGDFGKLRADLDRCAGAASIDAACTTVFAIAARTLTRGGVTEAEARTTLQAYLGWQPCGPTR